MTDKLFDFQKDTISMFQDKYIYIQQRIEQGWELINDEPDQPMPENREGSSYRILSFRKLSVLPPQSEGELWWEIISEIGSAETEKHLSPLSEARIINERTIKYLAEHYTLTRKSDVPEAVQFAEWLNKNASNSHWDIWMYLGKSYKLPALYEIFLQHKTKKT